MSMGSLSEAQGVMEVIPSQQQYARFGNEMKTGIIIGIIVTIIGVVGLVLIHC
jgi:hypothetical protein